MLELHDARNGKSFRTGIKARSVFARTSATLSGRYCRLRNYNKSMNSYRSIILYRVFKSLRRQGIELRIQDQGCVISTSFCANKTFRGSCCRRRLARYVLARGRPWTPNRTPTVSTMYCELPVYSISGVSKAKLASIAGPTRRRCRTLGPDISGHANP